MATLSSPSIRRRLPAFVGRIAALALVAVCVVPMLGSSPVARADDVDDLTARATAIATQLDALQNKIAALGEQFNQAQVRSAQLDTEMAATRRRLASAKKTEAARRADVARFALTAYVGGDGEDVLPLALDGRQWDLTRRNGYTAIEIGDRQQVVDDLAAAQQVDDDLMATLHDATAEQRQLKADLASQQAEAEKLAAQQQQLQDQVQGKLAVAVEQQQRAMAARAQAAAEARMAAASAAPSVTSDPSTAPAVTGEPGAPGATTQPPRSTGGTGTATTRPGTPPTPTNPPVQPPPVVTPPPPPPVVTPPSSGRGQTAANAALRQLGVRYSWGGGNASGPSYGFGAGAGIKGFDCSGLTLYAWAQAGVSLYHSAQMQYDQTRHVSMSQLQVGDLVFYGNSSRSISHVGLYIGGGQVVHAPNSRTVVQTAPVSLWGGYFAWMGAGRPG